MPSVSKGQARFVRAKAAEGKAWAKDWVKHERSTKGLPARKGKRGRKK